MEFKGEFFISSCFWKWLSNLIRSKNTNELISSSKESTDSP